MYNNKEYPHLCFFCLGVGTVSDDLISLGSLFQHEGPATEIDLSANDVHLEMETSKSSD